MDSTITPQDCKRMRELKKHPIDHSYDEECELFDGKVPEEQLLARDFQEILNQYPDSE